MNTTMEMKNEIQELNLNELEQANGGCLLCLALIGGAALFYSGVGTLAYLYNKSRK